MEPLPIPLIPTHALCRFRCGPLSLASIEVELAPFERYSETVRTSIRLDHIHFQEQSFAWLAGKTLAFPTNPDDGYIDGSVHIKGRHHPVDINVLSFGTPTDSILPLRLAGTLHFNDFHSGEDSTIALSLDVPLLLPYARQAMPAVVENAIVACGASGIRDLGKVMSELKRTTRYPEQLGELSQIVRRHFSQPQGSS